MSRSFATFARSSTRASARSTPAGDENSTSNNFSPRRARGMAASRTTVRWSPEARADLFEIWSYYRNEASESVADKIVHGIVERTRQLAEFPLTGRTRDELRAGLRSLAASPHVIFYRVRSEVPEIVRVLHGRRDLDEIFAEEA